MSNPSHHSLVNSLGLLAFYVNNAILRTLFDKIAEEFNVIDEIEHTLIIYANKRILEMHWNYIASVYPILNELPFDYCDFWNIDAEKSKKTKILK